MRAARISYLVGALAVGFSKALSAVAGLAGLWFLTQILPREQFGAYTFAMSVVAVLALLGSFGFERVLMLRIASGAPQPHRLRGTGLALKVIALGFGLSLLLSAALWANAERIVALGAFPEAGFWLAALAIAVVPMTVASLMQFWFAANHRVAEGAMLGGLVDAARASLFGVVFLIGGAPIHVAAAVTAAACLPIVVLSLRARGERRRAPHRLTRADLANGLVFLVQRVSTKGIRQIDLVMLGFLASGAATADYAVAARIAALCDTGRLALKPTFTPRIRRHLSLGERTHAQDEYHSARLIALQVALAGTAALAALGPWIFQLFGDYEAAFAPLLVLAAGYIVNAGTGMHATYLAMSGEVRLSALLRFVGLGLCAAMLAWLVPRHGALGAAFALLVTVVVINTASLALLAWRTGFTGLPRASLGVLILACLSVVATALGILQTTALSPLLAALMITVFAVEPRSRTLFRECLGLLRTDAYR